ncbi:hypothetical protein RNZ50_11395 [Paracoccaceae bacterium Fryx2]|nr:hypothetical protein [Paracoccaceae bacterium Fryx2]
MIVITGIGLGAMFGALQARRMGGKALDSLQYGAAYGIAFGILGLFVTIILERAL